MKYTSLKAGYNGIFWFEATDNNDSVYVMGHPIFKETWFLLGLSNDGLNRCSSIHTEFIDTDMHGCLLMDGVDIL